MAITCSECECVVMETLQFDHKSICPDCAGVASRWKIVAWWLGDAGGVRLRHECGYSIQLPAIEVQAGVIVTCEHCGKVGIMERRAMKPERLGPPAGEGAAG